MSSLNCSRLYKRVARLPVITIGSSTGKQTLIELNSIRFKASSTASAIKISEDIDSHHVHHHQHHDPIQAQPTSGPVDKSKRLTSSMGKSDSITSINNQQVFDFGVNNTKECYKSKTTSELIKALTVLKLCSFPMIVDNHQKLIKFGQKVLGRRLFRTLMKATFYGHFVAGEDATEMIPKINHLRLFGVKSIFDYSAEDEIHEDSERNVRSKESDEENQSNFIGKESVQDNLKKSVDELNDTDPREFRAIARSYFYLGEAQCEKNMEIFLNCIDSVADITDQTGFAAIKLTALCPPQLLFKLSKSITETKDLLKGVPDASNSGLNIVQFNVYQSNDSKLMSGLSENQQMILNLLSWNGSIPLTDVINYLNQGQKGTLSDRKQTTFRSPFNHEEEEMFSNLIRRIEAIARHAHETNVRIMIDAEQTYLQPAINRITMEMMKKYNKSKSIVFNTYQCYLKSAFDTMLLDLNLSYLCDFYFGAKLVRGAYMEQERSRAKNLGYEDPINENFEATTQMYHKTLIYLMKEIVRNDPNSKRIAIMAASHNEDTVRTAVENMERMGISPEHKVICFGQLYGMSDHISFSLGQSGYSVYKYIPYGPVEEVLPYLSRRAIENSSVLSKATHERNLLRREIIRRMISGDWFYNPTKCIAIKN